MTQSPARYGPAIDPRLLAAGRSVEQRLTDAADRYRREGDFRWLFSAAHAAITRRINRHLALFENPNTLLVFNRAFAEEYLRAVAGLPHADWQAAFRYCSTLQLADTVLSARPPFLWGGPNGVTFGMEACAAQMAQVHITVDIRAAISTTGCIPPADYGNMWHLVQLGADEALIAYRGAFAARIERWLEGRLLGPLVRNWRNAVYTAACGPAVPDVSPGFVRRYELSAPTDRLLDGRPSAP